VGTKTIHAKHQKLALLAHLQYFIAYFSGLAGPKKVAKIFNRNTNEIIPTRVWGWWGGWVVGLVRVL